MLSTTAVALTGHWRRADTRLTALLAQTRITKKSQVAAVTQPTVIPLSTGRKGDTDAEAS